jgi:hypothetical protein
MLQIITGKFFTTDQLYVTRQRAILYSNYAPPPYQQKAEPFGTAMFFPAVFETCAKQFQLKSW